MLGRRLIAAAIIISSIVGLLCADFWLGKDTVLDRPGLIVCAISILFACVCTSELVHMFNNVANRVNHTVAIGATAAMLCVMCAPALWTDYPADCALGRFGFVFSGLVLGLVIVFFMEMLTYDTPTEANGEVIDRLCRYGFILAYVAMCFGFVIPHRFLKATTELGNGYGILTIVTLVATVKLSDSFAYFAGKRFGTIKLAPKLSPGKTIQGSIGAPFGGCIAAAICIFLVAPYIFGITVQKPWWWFLVYGILVTAAGMVGDLAESMIKRDTKTKDSSSWLPGLGGVLDILDSMIFAAPISYFLWMIAELPVTSAN